MAKTVNQVVTIYKSGKAIKTVRFFSPSSSSNQLPQTRLLNPLTLTVPQSKTLLGVFQEAKTAYQDRKAEFRTAREDAQAKRAAASRSPSPPAPALPARPAYLTEYNNPNPAYHDDIYEETPPPLPARPTELRSKMTALQHLLEESHCVFSSAKSIVKSLESDPEKMAAVALSLAEIAALVKKAGITPAALGGLGKAFPAVVALLVSSEFLIAIGVGAGITVVALGGYKVVKRLQAKRVEAKEQARLLKEAQGSGDGDVGGVGEVREVIEVVEVEEAGDTEVDVNSIENWRRGVSEEDARSLESGIEGEVFTPAVLLEQQQELRRYQQQHQENLRSQRLLQSDEGLTLEEHPARQEELLMPTRSNAAGPELERERAKSKSPFEKLFRRKTGDARP